MSRVCAGSIGSDLPPTKLDLDLPQPWPDLLSALRPDGLRPIQSLALPAILCGQQHLVITAPTNSGKSLCAHTELLRTCLAGQRAVLIEPMRVIANEQAETIQNLIEKLAPVLSSKPHVRLSTGEFRHTNEFLSDPPPEDGEILVVTPERLELLLRNPDNDTFIASIGCVVVDEAHLLIDDRRGPVLESLITGLMLLAESQKRFPPRLVLLSATLPDPSRIANWLGGAEHISTTERYPSLTTWVEGVIDREAADTVVLTECQRALSTPETSVLIFVYKTSDAEKLARSLSRDLGVAVSFAHSQMPSVAKSAAIEAFSRRDNRLLVASSALAMGVNLPCTTVIVRDTHYPGIGPVPVHQLRQMSGRAGRGEIAGTALILAQGMDQRGADGLAKELSNHESPAFPEKPSWKQRADIPGLADRVGAILLRQHERGVDLDFLRNWCNRSLRGENFQDHLSSILDWLDWWKLAANSHTEFDDGRWRLTIGGRTAATHGLPFRLAGAVLQLWRDLLQVDSTDELLRGWSAFDHVLTLELLSDRAPSLRRDSAELNNGIQGWMERNVARHHSMLWREWFYRGDSKSEEILGSLGIVDAKQRPLHGDVAQKQIRQAILRTIVLSERMQGSSCEQLTRQWQLSNLVGVEEDWRDHRIWLSHGVAQLADWPALSWHCNHVLNVDELRKQRIKSTLGHMRAQALACCGSLSTCSPLGALLPGLRIQAGKANVGIGTLRKLESAGITDLARLMRMSLDDLVDLGVRRDLANQIIAFCRVALR